MGWTVLILLIGSATVSAQIPNWWVTNSLKLPEMPSGTLFHAEGSYSYYRTDGNVKGYIHKASPSIFVRNGRFITSISGNLSYQKLQIMNNPANRKETFSLNLKGIYDLTPRLQWESGLLWERDNNQYIDRRYVFYSGLIYNLFSLDNLDAVVFGAAGYQFLTSEEFLPILPVTEQNKPVAYVFQRIKYIPIEYVTLIQSFTYIHELDELGSHRNNLMLRAQFPVTKHLRVMVTRTTTYDKDPIIPELAPFVEKLNHSLTLGIGFNF